MRNHAKKEKKQMRTLGTRRKDRIPTIKKVEELRQRLAQEFNTNSMRGKVFKFVFYFNSAIKMMNL